MKRFNATLSRYRSIAAKFLEIVRYHLGNAIADIGSILWAESIQIFEAIRVILVESWSDVRAEIAELGRIHGKAAIVDLNEWRQTHKDE